MASIDFKTFQSVAFHVLDSRFPIILRGRHGIGKSEIVYQLETLLEYTAGVVERRASQMTEGDLIGLPSLSGGSTIWNPPDWFKVACDQPVLLFLDEIDRATPEVRQGIFELTDSRKINGHILHKDTVIVAAVNGGEHGAEYQVGEMDPAELDRYTVFDVEPTVEDWLGWSKGKVADVVWDFINNNRNHLEHNESFEPNKVYPSRRSWVRLDKTLQMASLLQEKMDDPAIFVLSQSFVGFEAAVKFKDFVANWDRQVSLSDIVDDGRFDLVTDFSINDHGAIIEKMEHEELFKKTLTEQQRRNVAEYMSIVPGELAMKLFTNFTNEIVNLQDEEKIGEIVNFMEHSLSVKEECRGMLVKDYLVQLIAGTVKEEE
jgi:hypothetical protein